MSGIADEPVLSLRGFDARGVVVGVAEWRYAEGLWLVSAGKLRAQVPTREAAEARLRQAGAVTVQPWEEKR